MRNILNLSVLFLLITSCSPTKKKDCIAYLLNMETEKSIYQEIKNMNSVVFYIKPLGKSMFKLHLLEDVDKDFLVTNRVLFINNKFYPLIFESDYLFYSKVKNGKIMVSYESSKKKISEIPLPEITIREKNPELYSYPQKRLVIDSGKFWIIDNNGKILSKL